MSDELKFEPFEITYIVDDGQAAVRFKVMPGDDERTAFLFTFYDKGNEHFAQSYGLLSEGGFHSHNYGELLFNIIDKYAQDFKNFLDALIKEHGEKAGKTIKVGFPTIFPDQTLETKIELQEIAAQKGF